MDACDSSDDDSPYELSVFVDEAEDDPGAVKLHLDDLARKNIVDAVRCTLQRHNRPTAAISIRIVTDETIAELHERTMNIPGPTVVLTFDLSDELNETLGSEHLSVEGDIVISIDTAAREADIRGHELVHELMLYAIHATLHLLDFDDLDESDAARMHAEEDAILESLGVGAVYGRPAS